MLVLISAPLALTTKVVLTRHPTSLESKTFVVSGTHVGQGLAPQSVSTHW